MQSARSSHATEHLVGADGGVGAEGGQDSPSSGRHGRGGLVDSGVAGLQQGLVLLKCSREHIKSPELCSEP